MDLKMVFRKAKPTQEHIFKTALDGVSHEVINEMIIAYKFREQILEGGGWFDIGNSTELSKKTDFGAGKIIYETKKGNLILNTCGWANNSYKIISKDECDEIMKSDDMHFIGEEF